MTQLPAGSDRRGAAATLEQRYAEVVEHRRGEGHLDARDEGFSEDSDQLVWSHLNAIGQSALWARRREIDRLVRDEDVAAPGAERRWRVDPIPMVFGPQVWDDLVEALKQRGRLLDAIYADLYGERRLIRERVFPGDLFLGHDGYLLPTQGIELPGPRQLPLAAADLTFGPDGWHVVTDRTQAPAGLGYALAHRRIVTRVMEPLFRALPSHRLRGFFDVLQHALVQAAPPGVTSPRVVLFSPGPQSETAYDQALLATVLGHPLVQSDDLVVRGGEVWLRGQRLPQRVDVIQRRVDGAWSDPLDLRPDSRLGVAGLVAATRRGAVSVVNPLGAGVLENVGMAPYLQAASRMLLDEDLRLTSPHTWWCGDAASRQHVLTHLDELVIRPTSRTHQPTIILGDTLSAAEREELAARIAAEPWAWAAQEPVESGTAPVVTSHGLSPRALSLRTFRVAVGDDYSVMPGGLAKVAAHTRDRMPLNRLGVISKDVWVLQTASAPTPAISEMISTPSPSAGEMPSLTPRAGGDLYWFGRYAERVEATTRLVSVTASLASDLAAPSGAGHATVEHLLRTMGQITGMTAPSGDGTEYARRVEEHLTRVLLDRDNAGSVAHALDRVVANTVSTRDLLSPETVAVVSELLYLMDAARETEENVPPQGLVTDILTRMLALSGLAAESLIRDEIWGFIDAGRRLERAQNTVALLLHTITESGSPVVDAVLAEMVLRTCDTLITYRRRMAAGVGAARPALAVVELLVADPTNPRSVRYQLDRLIEHYDSPEGAAIRVQAHKIRQAIEEAVSPDRDAVRAVLTAVGQGLRALSAEIERKQFAPQVAFAVKQWRRA